MSEDKDPKVDISSPEFKAGVDAGLNSTQATKNWQAGLELGQTLKAEAEIHQTVPETFHKEESTTPLFLRTGQDPPEKNGQDEKDE